MGWKNVYCFPLETIGLIIAGLVTISSAIGGIFVSIDLTKNIQNFFSAHQLISLEDEVSPTEMSSEVENVTETTTTMRNEQEFDNLKRYGRNIQEYVILELVLVMLFITSILLIVGIKKVNRFLILPWLIAVVIAFIYIMVILTPVEPGVLFVFPIAFFTYLGHIVYSIFIDIRKDKSSLSRLDDKSTTASQNVQYKY